MDTSYLENIIREAFENLPYELVTLKISNYKEKITLEIDHKENVINKAITLADCSEIAKILRSILDVELPQASLKFEIEVGSAGLDRILNHSRDYKRFIGKRISVMTEDVSISGGLRPMLGYLISADDSQFTMILENDITDELDRVNKLLTKKNRYSMDSFIEHLLGLNLCVNNDLNGNIENGIDSSCVDTATVDTKKMPDIDNINQISIDYDRIDRARLAPLFV